MRKRLRHIALVVLFVPACTAAWGERELERDEAISGHEIPGGGEPQH